MVSRLNRDLFWHKPRIFSLEDQRELNNVVFAAFAALLALIAAVFYVVESGVIERVLNILRPRQMP